MEFRTFDFDYYTLMDLAKHFENFMGKKVILKFESNYALDLIRYIVAKKYWQFEKKKPDGNGKYNLDKLVAKPRLQRQINQELEKTALEE